MDIYDDYAKALIRLFPAVPKLSGWRADDKRLPWVRPSYVRDHWREQPAPPEPYWKVAQRPPDDVDIDMSVSKLVADREAGAAYTPLRSIDALHRLRVTDPYLVAREFVALAHAYGCEAKRRMDATPKRSDYTSQIAADRDIVELLSKTRSVSMDLLIDPRFATVGSRSDVSSATVESCKDDAASTELNGTIGEARKRLEEAAQSLAGLLNRRIGDNEKRAQQARHGQDQDVYSRTFAEYMGYAWHLLTGRRPSNGERFVTFVAQGQSSLGAMDPAPQHAIRLVVTEVAKRPAWDQFARLSDGTHPPDRDLEMSALLQYDASEVEGRIGLMSRKFPLWSGALREMMERRLAHIDRLLASDVDHPAVSIVIRHFHQMGSADEKAHLAARGWRPAPRSTNQVDGG